MAFLRDPIMLGALLGDLAGSSFERLPGRASIPALASSPAGLVPLPEASCFTDDSICTAAIAESLMTGSDPAVALRAWGRAFPAAGYGPMFRRWLWDHQAPANDSFGNGAVMRASPCHWLADSPEEAGSFAEAQAAASHAHPRALKAARSMALLMGAYERGENAAEAARQSGIPVPRWESLPKPGPFRSDAIETLALALSSIEGASSFEDGLLRALSLGGDTDTNGAVAGAFLELRFFPGEGLLSEGLSRLASAEFAPLGESLLRFLGDPKVSGRGAFASERSDFARRLEAALRASRAPSSPSSLTP